MAFFEQPGGEGAGLITSAEPSSIGSAEAGLGPLALIVPIGFLSVNIREWEALDVTRSQRIRLVVAIAIAILSLFVALVGVPLIQARYQRACGFATGMQDTVDAMNSMLRAARVGSAVSLGAFAVAGVCFIYIFIALAAWFIGPPEK